MEIARNVIQERWRLLTTGTTWKSTPKCPHCFGCGYIKDGMVWHDCACKVSADNEYAKRVKS